MDVMKRKRIGCCFPSDCRDSRVLGIRRHPPGVLETLHLCLCLYRQVFFYTLGMYRAII